MHGSIHRATYTLAACAALTLPASARGQWSTEGGQATYEFAYTTSATFFCPRGDVGGGGIDGTCAADGSSLRLTNDGGGQLTISFTGRSRGAQAVGGRRTTILFGELAVEREGFFLFPGVAGSRRPLFTVEYEVRSINPVVGTRTLAFDYVVGTGLQIVSPRPVGSTLIAFPLAFQPAELSYDALVIDRLTRPTISTRDLNPPGEPSYFELQASASLVPEPSTLALGAVGLVALAGVARQRRA